MKAGFTIATVLAAALNGIEAKEHYVIKEDILQQEHNRPKVEKTINERCAYESASFSVCSTYGATAKIGWEWSQEYYALSTDPTDKSYTLKLDFYSSQGVDLTGNFFADRLFADDISVTLNEFKGLFTI